MGWGESVYMPGEGKGTQPQMQKRHIILWNGWYWEDFRDYPEGVGEIYGKSDFSSMLRLTWMLCG